MRHFYYFCLSLLSELVRVIYKKRLRVLAFHDVPDKIAFHKQIKYLSAKYNIISIDDLKSHLENNKCKLPSHPLLITFDDGDYSFIENGFSVLKKNRVPACLFIITGLINTKKMLWTKLISETYRSQGKSENEIRQRKSYLKSIDNKKREELLASNPQITDPQLTAKNLKLLKCNNIYIGNHSHTHPMFNKCCPAEIQFELDTSKLSFENWKITGYDIFAYPNGNFDNTSELLLKKNDIKLAFLFNHKINPSIINPYRISRIKANSNMSVNELKVKVSGLHSLIQKL